MKKLIKFIATFFYLGYTPYIPGTVASCAALVFYFLFKDSFFVYTILLVGICAIGFLVAGKAEKIFQEKDCGKIVIDEVAGMLLAFWGLSLNLPLIIAGFFIFRFLDMVKVFPADRIQRKGASIGIMGDDLIAGIYTNIILQIVSKLSLCI